MKYEGLNPTGSFKDRGMTMAVTKAVEDGARAIICASTGNTSAAAAAYAARAGIACFVLIPEGKIALGKLAQAMVHGAVVIQIEGNFDAGMELVKQMAERTPVTIVNSINPFRLQGQKTAAFEIVDALGGAPDYHCLPVGNAGNISAYWMGYSEYHKDGVSKNRPVMAGYQASGAAPFLLGKPIDNPETVATAIRIGNPQSWDKAIDAQQSSGGWFEKFTDEQILAAQKLLAHREGVYCEPASAISVAGAIHDIRSGKIRAGSRVVCTLTGHGLKDPDIAIKHNTSPVRSRRGGSQGRGARHPRPDGLALPPGGPSRRPVSSVKSPRRPRQKPGAADYSRVSAFYLAYLLLYLTTDRKGRGKRRERRTHETKGFNGLGQLNVAYGSYGDRA